MIHHEPWFECTAANPRTKELQEAIRGGDWQRVRDLTLRLGDGLFPLFNELLQMGMLRDFGKFLVVEVRSSSDIAAVMDRIYALPNKPKDVLDFIWWIRTYSHDWVFQDWPPLTAKEVMQSPEEHIPKITVHIERVVVQDEGMGDEERSNFEDVEVPLKEFILAMTTKRAPHALKSISTEWDWPGDHINGGGMGWMAAAEGASGDEIVTLEAYVRPDHEVTEDQWDQLKKWAKWPK